MSLIHQHLDKNNLHHAYLIEGEREEIEKDIIQFIENLGVRTRANSDFSHISVDSFKIDDARNLKALSVEKGISKNRRIFLISVNNFLLEAQNSLLKMFEEPIENTHFFLVVPDANIFLPTFISRFYVISAKQSLDDNKDVEKFISMSLPLRLNFIKELLLESKDKDEVVIDSVRAKSLKFLNSLEQTLRNKILKNSAVFTFPGVPGGSYTAQNFPIACFEHFFKVRKYLSQPGSSAVSYTHLTLPTILRV